MIVRLCDLRTRSPNKRQCTVVDPPIYVWDSRPNPAIVVRGPASGASARWPSGGLDVDGLTFE